MAPASTSSLSAWQRQSAQAKWQQVLSLLVLLAAIAYLATFIVLSALRSVYPYELEWTEGASIDEIRWIAEGKALYQEPSIFFLPLLYNPLYFYLAAAAARIVGIGFFAPRLISVLATLGIFYLLYRIVVRSTGHPLAGLAAAGIYAASFRFTGAWMDLAKSDSLFLFFLLAAFSLGQTATGRWGRAASGLFYILAYFTKQLALPIILVLAALSLVETRGRTWLQWAAIAALGLAAFLSLDWLSSGWFSFYSVETIALHHRTPDLLYFWRVLLIRMAPAVAVGLLYPLLILRGRHKQAWPEHLAQNLSLAAALVLASWSIFFKAWTYDNGFMPAAAGLSLLAGLGAGQVQKSFNPGSRFTLQAVLLLLLFAQFGLFLYNPLDQLPTPHDREAAGSFIQKLRGLPGEVLVFNHGYVNTLAGKTSYLHSVTIADVAGGDTPPQESDIYRRREKILQMLQGAVTGQHFDWVILDKPGQGWSPYYLMVAELYDPSDLYYPVTGALSRPELLMVKNPVVYGGSYPLDDPVYSPFFTAGWSEPSEGGRPAVGPASVLQVALHEGSAFQVRLEAEPYCTAGTQVAVPVIILWNDDLLGEISFTPCERESWSFDLPASAVRPGMNELKFTSQRDPAAASEWDRKAGEPWFTLSSLLFTRK